MRALFIMLFLSSAHAAEPMNEWSGEIPWQRTSDGFQIKKNPLGSGEPSSSLTEGTDVAVPVADGLYHVPGALPNYPTAATIWPRVQTITCDRVGEKIVCDGYDVNRSPGRGEYVYVQPHVKELPVLPEVPPVNLTLPPEEPPKVFKKPKPPRKKLKKSLVCK